MPKLKSNPNHPRKGSCIKVEPIRNLSDIAKLKELLSPCPRNYCLFTLGINTALRANELVSIRIGQVAHLETGDDLTIKQSKNNKYRTVTINQNAYEAIQQCLSAHPKRYCDRYPLFFSKTSHGALKAGTVSKYMKRWCNMIGLQGNFASHTMRKTFGYHAYRNLGQDHEGSKHPRIAELMIAYGHATERQTLSYLCIQDKDISGLYLDNLL